MLRLLFAGSGRRKPLSNTASDCIGVYRLLLVAAALPKNLSDHDEDRDDRQHTLCRRIPKELDKLSEHRTLAWGDLRWC